MQANQRQAQEKLGQRELALDPVGDGLLEAVEDQIARLVGEHVDVVPERRPRVAKLHQVLAGAREDLAAGEARRVRGGLPQLGRGRHQHHRLARPRPAPRVDDAEARLEIVQALLGRQQAQERNQAIDGGEAGAELPAEHGAPRVGGQPGQVEPSLPERDPLQHPQSVVQAAGRWVSVAEARTAGRRPPRPEPGRQVRTPRAVPGKIRA